MKTFNEVLKNIVSENKKFKESKEVSDLEFSEAVKYLKSQGGKIIVDMPDELRVALTWKYSLQIEVVVYNNKRFIKCGFAIYPDKRKYFELEIPNDLNSWLKSNFPVIQKAAESGFLFQKEMSNLYKKIKNIKD